MQKAFEKIVERLMLASAGSKVYKLINPNKEDIAEFNAYKKAIEIVNQVAEEYGKDNNVRSNEITSLDEVINRLQYKADNIKEKLEPSYFTECIDYLKSLPRCDDGWIPCSERFPSNTENVLITTVYGVVLMAYFGTSNKWCYPNGKRIEDSQDMPIAWCELTQPYVKGE